MKKHMQRTFKTHEIYDLYGCNMCSSICCLGKWMLVDAELDIGVELDAMK
jgi:epoxyqueuosine reductase QueG